MTQSNEIGELAKALSAAQAIMGNAHKDSNNPFFKSKYADLTAVIEAIREPFAKNGLSFLQPVGSKEDGVYVTTMICHSSGQYISDSFKLKISKDDMQGLGSAISYGRRYGLQSMVGLGADDDDGEAAVGRTTKDVVAKAIEEVKRTPLPDFELDSLAHVVFKGKKTLLQNWLLKNYGTVKMAELTPEQVNNAKSILTDAKDNGIDLTI